MQRGLRAALSELDLLENELDATGIADANRAFNLTWHDWLNLKSLVQVSRVIAEAALARTDSRGAHFREDFPEAGPLDQSAYTSARLKDGTSEYRHETGRLYQGEAGRIASGRECGKCVRRRPAVR